MGQPYVGEIRVFCGNFAPVGWMFCQGQPLPISEYDVLFNLIGTTYGGDGQETFNLPNLASRIPVHMGTASFGQTFTIGETGGEEQVTLTTQQIPSHSHVPQGLAGAGANANPQNGVWAECALTPFSSTAPSLPMNAAACGATGGSQPHDNMMPYLVVNFIISLYGIYPSQT